MNEVQHIENDNNKVNIIHFELTDLVMTYTGESIRGWEPEGLDFDIELNPDAPNVHGEYTEEYLTEHLNSIIVREASRACRRAFGTILQEFCVGIMDVYDRKGDQIRNYPWNPSYRHCL
jgi:hypothetical protein